MLFSRLGQKFFSSFIGAFLEFWFATGNKGKIDEYKLLLRSLGGESLQQIPVHSQNELRSFSPRPETGKTFRENSLVKAKTLAAVKNHCWVFGEDSGLEVKGLDGLPGIHSARYAGPKASESENNAKLLKMLQLRGVSDRSARFVCDLTVLNPQGETWHFEGELKGTLAPKLSGLHGFGYDPLFIPEGETKTLAELGPGYKVTKSHRAQAFQKFLDRFKSGTS